MTKTRSRKTDAHIATIRVSVPIDPMEYETVQDAARAIKEIQCYLPPGSTVEVLNSRFGRVDAPVAAEPQMALAMSEIAKAVGGAALSGSGQTLPITPSNSADDIPDSLRRVPRQAPNGGTPMDPSGDGSYRGPDGAA